MRTKQLLFGAIFVILGMVAQSQVYEMYYQGFESGEQVRYSVTPGENATTATDLVSGGSQALKLVQSTSTAVEMYTDTIDFTQNTSLTYIALEFDHINTISPMSTGSSNVAQIFVKRANQTDQQWVQLTSQYYNKTEGSFSSAFDGLGAFNNLSYGSEWSDAANVSNDSWKHERFDFSTILQGVPNNERKLIFRFTLRKRTSTGANTQGWWIDNLRVRASQNEMRRPMISMFSIPDGGAYPNSRGTTVVLDTRTTVAQGINPDSVYLVYTVGSDPTRHKVTMTPQGNVTGHDNNNTVWERYSCRLPFEGYDTLMQFYCVVRDASSNANEATYPSATDSWVRFWYVRGTEQLGVATPGFTGNQNYQYFPFPNKADNKSEWIYDSTLMANAGYGPGAITDLRFTIGTALSAAQTRQAFQIRMKNVPTSHTQSASAGEPPFISDFMQVVFDSNMTFGPYAAGEEFTIHLTDTFFYGGGDLVMQTLYNNDVDPAAISIKMITAPNNKKTIYRSVDVGYGSNPYSDNQFSNGLDIETRRPAIVMTQHANLPLLYDMGVSAILFPNDSNSVMSVPSHIDVKLNNFGARAVNAIRISYTIDDTIFGHFDWTGPLAAGAETTVTIEDNMVLPAGFHYLRTWVEDTLTAAGMQYRDHEPLNDTSYAEFIVCEGALSGVRQIGGQNADYNTIDEFLFSLTRCGMDSTLVVKLAPGLYKPFVMPEVQGHSQQNYIVFESLDTNNHAIFYGDATTGADYLIDVTALSDIHFRHIDFVRYEGLLSGMVKLAADNKRISFTSCSFKDMYEPTTLAERIPAMINTNAADSISIDNCLFEGATVGVNAQGTSALIHSVGISVSNSVFRNQINSAVNIENHDDIVVTHNEMYDVLTNAGKVVQLLECAGTIEVTSNRIYTTHGSSAIGVSGVHGTATNRAVVANNMIVCDDDGSANQLFSPLNIVSAEYTDVVYNSVKLIAPQRNNVAAATFGGGSLLHSRFMNNIVASFSVTTNYAFGYMPLSDTTAQVGHNVYYSAGNTLFRYQGAAYQTLAQWQQMVPQDTASVVANPGFLNGSLFDLRTFNRQLKGIGVPMANVTVDIFDAPRATDSTCPGAFEYVALFYDFETEALLSPLADVCDMPDSVEMVLSVRNNGISVLTDSSATTLKLAYRINNGAVDTIVVTDTVPAEGVAEVHTGTYLQLPSNGTLDATYSIKMWVVCDDDPNKTNDTSVFTVVSRYQSTAPTDVFDSVDYMTSATVTITEGVDQWSVYNDPAAPKRSSTVYWYYGADDEEPFMKGSTLVTTELRQDTDYYVSQHRELPIVRITQVMMKNTGAVGVPNPMPSWMTNNTVLAVQLTNIGDDTAFLQGDTLRIVAAQPNTNLNNKFIAFGNVFIAPGKSLVVQFNSGNSSNTETTVYSGARITPASTANFGIVYRHNGHAEDALPLNGLIAGTTPATQAVTWANEAVPSYVWSGNEVQVSAATVGGLIRTGFTGTASDWLEATAVYTLSLESTDPSWILYSDNGCQGQKGHVSVVINNPPATDVEVTALAMAEGCGLGEEPVSVRLRNYGDSAIVGLQLNYTLGADTVSEVLTYDLVSGADTTFTFAQQANLAFEHDSAVTINIWATAMVDDPHHSNDSTSVSTVSLFTPELPVVAADDTSNYGERDTLTIAPVAGRLPVWYDYDMNVADTGYTYITDLLYSQGTVGVSYIGTESVVGRVGLDDTKLSNKNNYPSPYLPQNKNVKQQYIYTASELQGIGLEKGYIYSLAFHLDSIHGGKDSIVLENYRISLGTTTANTFTSTTAWKNTEIYLDMDSLIVYRSSSHDWIWHVLDRPYLWDGESNLVVQVVFENSAAVTSGLQTAYSTAANTVLYNASNSAVSPSTIDYVGAGKTPSGNRPNIMFNGDVFGCNGPISSINVHLIGIPDHDAMVAWPTGFDTVEYTTCVDVTPQVSISNLGGMDIEGFSLYYYFDSSDVADTTVLTDTISAGDEITVPLFSKPIAAGRHSIKLVVAAEGDTIATNDTIQGYITVRFCGGVYSIGLDSTADFHTFKSAVDTLNTVGITGPVMFLVEAGTYNEQVQLGNVYGSSATNTISFVGSTSDSIGSCLIGNTSAADNYVFRLDSASYVTIENLTIVSRPVSGNAANALVLNGCGNITVRNSTLRVKSGINNAAASCLVMENGCGGLTLVNSSLDSGYYSLKAATSDNRYENIYVQNNTFSNFMNTGIDLNGVTVLEVSGNELRSGATAASQALNGMVLANVDSTITIKKNKVYLVDASSGAKVGIKLNNVMGNGLDGAYFVNNMISAKGTGNAYGIHVDGNSSNLSIYYNTVRVDAGEAQKDIRAFFATANTSNLRVMSNIFSNHSRTYAYYVASANSISMSDYNDYYNTGTTKLAYWGADRATLTALQNANNKDENSVQEEPIFISPDDLHLLMTNLCGKAQYNTEVLDDIDGNTRPPMPSPTIGAHEMDRLDHNVTILRITDPKMPTNINNPLNTETDLLVVKAEFYNNGASLENDVRWYAYVVGHEDECTSEIRQIGPLASTVKVVDSVIIAMPLGVIDTQMVKIVLVSDNDEDMSDNEMSAQFYLAPAFNIQAVKITATGQACAMQNTTVAITVKNVGSKDIPAGTSIDISYTAQGYHPSIIANNPDSNKVYIPTMPTGVTTETYTFETALTKTGTNSQRVITFATPANLYPTDTSLNIKVRLRGWLNYQYDIKNENDTASYITAEANYVPQPPHSDGVTVPYGTWGEVTATQNMSRPVRWYRDTTATHFYPKASDINNYEKSRVWNTTPQYFHDSIYYLRCYSDKNCPSAFSPVTVHVAPRVTKDVAIEAVLAPLGGRVYSENDTVRVRIANYGTQSISNVPVTFQLRKGNNTAPIQQVTQICSANISAGQTYVYTFDSLLHFSSPTTASSYQLRVWTDLSTDMVRRNDTIRMKNQLRPASDNNTELDYTFSTFAESKYPSRTNTPSTATDEVDIIRFSFNEIDVDLPPLGRTYTNFGAFNNPEYPVLHVTRGMQDTVYMMITNPADQNAVERGKVAVYIDFNRNGSFADSGECVLPVTNLYNNTLLAENVVISNNASLGYMKMRVVATNNAGTPSSNLSGTTGHVLDFLLFVDKQAPAKDLAITKIISPRSYLIKNADTTVVTFRMANRGSQAITSAEIHYDFEGEEPDTTSEGSFNWTGNLLPGTSVNVDLPAHVFQVGTTNLSIWHTLSGDVQPNNDHLDYEYHRFHNIVLELVDDFDSLNYWYAPTGYNAYSRNYWQKGTPNKTRIRHAYSAPNAWVTDLTNAVASGTHGNVSYLYSPIINIAQIKPDTLSFRLSRNLTGSSSMHLEYYNYQNMWVKVESDSSTDNWYNDEEKHVFNGTDTNYVLYRFRTSYISGNFQENMQLRLVYSTPQGSSTASYGDGCAVDNFRISRAQRSVDHGVTEIIYPVNPQYGQTVYPKMVVKNFGFDTLRNLKVGYTHYGTNLAKVSTFTCNIAPNGGIDTFEMTTPFVITSSFPDTFMITAFTISSADRYHDNDTSRRQYVLLPLDNDVSAEAILAPLDHVIAGDSLSVSMRIRNFGAAPLGSATFQYFVSGQGTVTEQVDFLQLLDRPLASMEYFNYTFHQRFRAAMGVMNVTAVVKSDSNDYIYNDTVTKRIMGISSITDVAAASIVLDYTNTNVKVELMIENRGARGVNDFEVGYFINGDTTNVVRETFHAHNQLPALSTGCHVFAQTLPVRSTPYDSITAFVLALNDNDHSNDTTSLQAEPFVDLEAIEVLVEEKANPDCRVFVRLRNNGNFTTFGRQCTIDATINGNPLQYVFNNRAIMPGSVALIQIPRTIPKSPQRQYSGSATVTLVDDTVVANNQTSVVRVVNYVEGVPMVPAEAFELGQNYPNPFSQHTVIPFALSEAAHVRIFVMDATGHLVYNTEAFYPAGNSQLQLDMGRFPAGVYYYGIETNQGRQMRKMIMR